MFAVFSSASLVFSNVSRSRKRGDRFHTSQTAVIETSGAGLRCLCYHAVVITARQTPTEESKSTRGNSPAFQKIELSVSRIM